MTIIRACSKTFSVTPAEDPTHYSEIIATIAQDGVNLVNKTLSDMEISGADIIVRLSQEETKQFKAGVRAWLQMRFYAGEYDAPGSPEWPVDVMPVLDDQILGGE